MKREGMLRQLVAGLKLRVFPPADLSPWGISISHRRLSTRLRSESGAEVTVFRPAIIVVTSFCNSNSNEVEEAIYTLTDSPFRCIGKFKF